MKLNVYISIITFDIPNLLYVLFPFFKQVWQIVFYLFLYENKVGHPHLDARPLAVI